MCGCIINLYLSADTANILRTANNVRKFFPIEHEIKKWHALENFGERQNVC